MRRDLSFSQGSQQMRDICQDKGLYIVRHPWTPGFVTFCFSIPLPGGTSRGEISSFHTQVRRLITCAATHCTQYLTIIIII